MIKKFIGIMLALCIILQTFSVTSVAEVHAAESSFDGYSKVAESTDYNLYMREEDLSLIVEDKSTGKYMSSALMYDDGQNNATWLGAMNSALVLTVIKGNDDTKQVDLLNDDTKVDIDYTSNGFTADVYFTKYKFGMTLEVSLDDDGLLARISDDSIVEDGEDYQIGTIEMYPFMGNSYLDDNEGYLFVPDGNGALIYLDDKDGAYSTGFSSAIYGTDTGFDDLGVTTLLWDKYEMVTEEEKVIAPVFGIAHTDDEMAYLAVVEEGDCRATIECQPNGANVNYNRAYAKFTERRIYTQPTSNNSTTSSLSLVESDRTHSDLAVRFIFLSGESANYAGMANAYRSYLMDRGELTARDTAYRTRVDFLGTDRESWLLSTKAVVMTTVDDISDIYSDLEESGVTDLFTIYKGWQKGGIYNLPITSYKADSEIGGTSALTELISDSTAAGIKFYLYSDSLRINPDEHNATFNVVKMINKRRYSEDTYMDVYESFVYLTPSKAGSNLLGLLKSYKNKGVDSLCVSGISNSLFSYTYAGKTYSRKDTQESFESTLDTVAAEANLVLEEPFSYIWKDTEAFVDMPLYTSNFVVEDESVPFLSIVLSGVMPVYSEYVNFEANKKEFFLKLVETGTYPSFYITEESAAKLINTNSADLYSTEYTTYKEDIISYTEELKALSEKLDGSSIVSHDMFDNGVTRVVYDNGVSVYINYSDESQTQDDVTIEAMSYEVR